MGRDKDKKKEKDPLDDYVVADMSGLERRNILFPRRPDGSSVFSRNSHANHADYPGYQENFDYSESKDIDKSTTFWYMMGALKAGLLISGAFILGLGLIVLLMYIFF